MIKTCIFSVIKDEHEYIEEFIRYHIDIGIDTLFLFEDVGSKSHNSICEKYSQVVLNSVTMLFNENENVINRRKNGERLQGEYIKRGLLWIRDNFDYDWCFSIDADEFITPTDTFPSLLSDYNDYDALILQWKNFGANGLVKKPKYDKPTWEIFTKPCDFLKFDIMKCQTTKVCYNMKRLEKRFIYGVHSALCRLIKPNFKYAIGSYVYDRIYIRHYITRSWEEYVWKIKVRGDICDGNRKISHFFEMNKDMLPMKDKLIKELGEENEMEQPS